MRRLFDNLPAPLIAILYIVAVTAALAFNYAVARVVIALLLVFLLPGYAITAALFPHTPLGKVERVLFTLGLSLAVSILGALVLNITPWGLQATSWAALLVSTTVVATGVAWLRGAPAMMISALSAQGWPSLRQVLLIGLAILVVGGVLIAARTPAASEGFQGYTLLWMLPDKTSHPHTVRLGVSSKEFTPMSYRLEVKMNNQMLHTWSLLKLRPNEQWEARIDVTPQQLANGTVEAFLYRLDSSGLDTLGAVYRHVVLRPEK